MNRFFQWLERRQLATPSPDLLQLFSSGPTDSGQIVTPQTALSVPSVFSCCQILAQDVARTPLQLKRQIDKDTYEDATEHPLYELLNTLPNPEMTAFQFKSFLQWQLLTFGVAFAEIVRIDGRIDSLWPLDANYMRVDRVPSTRTKRWTYAVPWNTAAPYLAPGGKPAGQVLTWLFDPSQPPIFELVMESPINRCREAIGCALAQQQFVARYFANNARPNGMLVAPGPLTTEQAGVIRDLWASNMAGSGNRGKIPVIGQGLAFTPIQSENDSAQLNETMKALAMAICGAFRVPPWKAGLMESTTYSNMESGENTYVTSTLDPLFENWEEALRRDLLTSRQYGSYSIAFDRQSLVRNDVKGLYQSLSQGVQNGFLSQNDCRRALGLNPIPNGDVYMVNSALQPVGTPPVVA